MARAIITPYGKYYRIDSGVMRYSAAALKPTKTAAGAMFTIARHGSIQKASADAFQLAYYGTFDTLARTNRMRSFRQRNYKAVTVTRWVKKG